MIKYYIMMFKIKMHKIWAFFLIITLLATTLSVNSFAYTSQVGNIKASNVNVRSGPGTNYSKLAKLSLGTQVVVTEQVTGSDGQQWYAISYNNGTKDGFVLSSYVTVGSDGVYSGLSEESFEQMLTNQGFPDSYKPYLRALHKQYPNWTFTAVKTGLDWDTALDNESVVGRNLVYKDSKSSWKSTEDGAFDWDNNYWPGFDGANWQAASREIIAYYMDPRNFLDATYVFQFVDQKYNSNIHKPEGVETMVKGTFMESTYTGALAEASTASTTVSGDTSSMTSAVTTIGGSSVQLVGPGQASAGTTASSPTSTSGGVVAGPSGANTSGSDSGPGVTGYVSTGNGTYVDMIMKAAEQSGVNPYVLTSMILQEQGKKGTSGSISGTNSSYPGIYNYYNVEAYASGGMDAVTRGLWWASQSGTYDRPWNSQERAIVGGAKFYGEGYVKKTQNTFYLKKFNVTSNNTYKHQYMTNVQAAASEGYNLAQAYASELRTAAHNFEIPVYNNMPDTACACPLGEGSPNNKLYGLGVEGFAITPTFNRDTYSYDLIVDPSVTSVNVLASQIDNTANVRGTGTVNLTDGTNKIEVLVTAQNGVSRTYTINVVRQSGGPTYSAGVGGVQSGPGVTTTGGPSVVSVTETSSGTTGTSGSTGTSGTTIVINTDNASGSSTGSSGQSSSKTTVVLIGPGQ